MENQMLYFSKKVQEYQAKNSLQKFALEQLKPYNHLLVESAEKFTQVIQTTVTNANRAYPRCTPLQVNSWVSETTYYMWGLPFKKTPDRHVRIEGLVQFDLYCVMGELLGQPGEVIPIEPAHQGEQLVLSLLDKPKEVQNE